MITEKEISANVLQKKFSNFYFTTIVNRFETTPAAKLKV